MKDGTTYPRNTALAILIGGDPGAAKSNLCMEFTDPWFIDADHNLRNATERHPGKRFWWDDPELDDAGKELAHELRWPRVEALLRLNAPRPEVKCIVGDGLGRFSDYLKDYLCWKGGDSEKVQTIGGVKVMNRSLWDPFATLMKRFVILARSYNKPFILTTHLGVDENELTAVKEQKVLLQGALKADFPKLFTDFWGCFAVPSSDVKYTKTLGVRYYVRTVPTTRCQFKQSCGLPAEFEHDAPEFKRLIVGLNGAPVVTAVPVTLTPPAGGAK